MRKAEPALHVTSNRLGFPNLTRFALSLFIVGLLLFPILPLDSDAEHLSRFSRPNSRVNWSQGRSSGGPDIAAETDGFLHAVWAATDAAGYNVYYANSTDEGSTWSDATLMSMTATSSAVAVDESGGMFDGAIYVVYATHTVSSWSWDVFVRKSDDRGRTWSSRVRVDSAPDYITTTCSDLGVNKIGTIFAIFVDSRSPPGDPAIYVSWSTDGGVSWNNDALVSTYSTLAHCPSLHFDNLGQPYVSWTSRGPPGEVYIAHSSDGGFSWTTEEVVNGNSGVTIYGSGMTIDPTGSIYLAWSTTNKSTQNRGGVYVSRSDDGKTWTTPVNATHGGYTFYSTFPVAYAGPPVLEYLAGDVYVFWSGNRTVWLKHLDDAYLHNDLDLYFSVSQDRGESWIGDDRVDDLNNPWTGMNQIAPKISTSRYGIHVIWLDRRLANGGYSVWSSSHSIEALLVTELVDSPAGQDYVEIFSQSHEALPLQGYHLAVGALDIPLDSLDVIGPDEHVLVGPCSTCDLQVPSLDLPEQGGEVTLYDQSGQLLDEIAYGQKGLTPDPISSESVSRYWTGEKYLDEWARSPATPKDYNSGGRFDFGIDVVMTEIHLNDTAPTRSFIELYYKGESVQDLTGFALVGNEVTHLPSVLLDQNNRRLALTGQDAPSFFQSLNRDKDNVYLYSSSGDLVDAAGWSSPIPNGGSLARLPKMEGGRRGFNETSSEENGWLRLPTATLPLIELEQDSSMSAPPGGCAHYPLSIRSLQDDWHTIDLSSLELTHGVQVSFLSSDGVSPLVDTNANGFVDIGSLAPGGSASIYVSVCLSETTSSVAQVVVFAVSSRDSSGDAVLLETLMRPNLLPSASANPSSFYLEGSPPFYPSISTMKVSVEGRGYSGSKRHAQDVVILLDASGSILPETFQFMKNATAAYIDRLEYPDRVSIYHFWDKVKVVGSITDDYELAKERLDFLQLLRDICQTSIGTALVSTLDEFLWNANSSHERLIIILTDGRHTYGRITPEEGAMYAWQNNTRVFPIGMCDNPSCTNVRFSTLRNMAQNSDASYFRASNQEELEDAYDSILQYMIEVLSDVAGYDDDLLDESRMVRLDLPSYIHIQTATFVDPDTGQPRHPDYVDTGNNTYEWNVDQIKLGEDWKVSFQLTSTRVGPQIGLLPSSRVLYTNSTGSRITVPFNEVRLNVTQPIEPLTILSIGEPNYSSGKKFVTSHTPLTLEAADFSGTGISLTWFAVDGGWKTYQGQPFYAAPEGTRNVQYYSVDNSGLEEDTKDVYLTVDDSPPEIKLSLTGPQYQSDFTYVTSQTEISIVCWDKGLEPSGLQYSAYRVYSDGWWSPWQSLVPFHLAGSDGFVLVESVASDMLGNENQSNWTFVLDNSAPATMLTVGAPSHEEVTVFVTSSTDISLWGVDQGSLGSGLSHTDYRIWAGAWTDWQTYALPFNLPGEGYRHIQFRSIDNVGNVEDVKNATFYVDDSPPLVTSRLDGQNYTDGSSTFVRADTALCLHGKDLPTEMSVGVSRLRYRLKDFWVVYDLCAFFSGVDDGQLQVTLEGIDKLGNSAEYFLIFTVDNTPPETMVNYSMDQTEDTWSIVLTGSDSGSGVAFTEFSVDGGNWTVYEEAFKVNGEGLHTVSYRSVDNLDNRETVKYLSLPHNATGDDPGGNPGTGTGDGGDGGTGNGDDPGEEPEEGANYKPLVALAFCLLLSISGYLAARRRASLFNEIPRKIWLKMTLPFVVVEAGTGVFSFLTGALRVPSPDELGMIVDMCILLVGVVFHWFHILRRPRSERASDEESLI